MGFDQLIGVMRIKTNANMLLISGTQDSGCRLKGMGMEENMMGDEIPRENDFCEIR